MNTIVCKGEKYSKCCRDTVCVSYSFKNICTGKQASIALAKGSR
jgi:hypothetical protein